MVASSYDSRSAQVLPMGHPHPGVSKQHFCCVCCRLGFTREDALKRFIFVQEVGEGGCQRRDVMYLQLSGILDGLRSVLSCYPVLAMYGTC
jgi:hypothetical protein